MFKIIILPHSPYFAVEKQWEKIFSAGDDILWMSGNHTGKGERFALQGEGELTSLLMKYCPLLRRDELAFLREEIPLRSLHSAKAGWFGMTKEKFGMTKILFMPTTFERCQRIAKEMFKAIEHYKKSILIVVSSNLNHFEQTEEKDYLAIEKIKNLDSTGFFEATQKNNMSICGATAITIALEISRLWDAKEATFLGYAKNFDIGHGSFLIQV